MFHAYRVGVLLKLTNLISPELVRLSQQFTKLDALAKSMAQSMKGFAGDAAGLKLVANAAGNLGTKLSAAGTQATALHAQLTRLKAMGTGAPAVSGGSAMPVPIGQRRAAAFGHGPIHGGNLHIGSGGIGMGAVGLGMGAMLGVPGLIAVGAGYAGFAGVRALANAGGEKERLVTRLRAYGMTPEQNAEALRFAKKNTVFGTSEIERIRLFSEAQGIFRESSLPGEEALKAAKVAMPYLAKIHTISSTLDEESSARLRTSSVAMMRFIEPLANKGGKIDAERFAQLAEMGYKLILTSGGNVNWEQFRQVVARGRNATANWNEEAFAMMEPIIGELKGGATGWGQTTGLNRLQGIVRVPNQAVRTLMDAGWWDKSKVVLNSQGGIKQFRGNPLDPEIQKRYMTNPARFVMEDLKPLFARMKLTDVNEQSRMANILLGGTGGYNAMLILKQEKTILHALEAFKTALSIDENLVNVSKTYLGNVEEFHAAWTDFKTVFGEAILPQVTQLIRELAEFVRTVAGWYEQNKELIAAAGSTIKTTIGGTGGNKFGSAVGAPGIVDRMTGGGLGSGVDFVTEGLSSIVGAGKRLVLNLGNAPQSLPLPQNPVVQLQLTDKGGRILAEGTARYLDEQISRPPIGPRRPNGQVMPFTAPNVAPLTP